MPKKSRHVAPMVVCGGSAVKVKVTSPDQLPSLLASSKALDAPWPREIITCTVSPAVGVVGHGDIDATWIGMPLVTVGGLVQSRGAAVVVVVGGGSDVVVVELVVVVMGIVVVEAMDVVDEVDVTAPACLAPGELVEQAARSKARAPRPRAAARFRMARYSTSGSGSPPGAIVTGCLPAMCPTRTLPCTGTRSSPG